MILNIISILGREIARRPSELLHGEIKMTDQTLAIDCALYRNAKDPAPLQRVIFLKTDVEELFWLGALWYWFTN